MSKDATEIKYRFFWSLGTVLSFILYFSGICAGYIFFTEKILKRHRTIILTYHRIKNDGKDPDITVSTENFEKEMAYLKKHFDIVALDAIFKNNLENKSGSSMSNIAITFDDGYKDNYSNAYPILKKYQLPATIFLVSGVVGKKKDMLNMDEINIMKKDRIDVGSHTITHKILTEVNLADATEEIFRSKECLESLLNQKIQFFAYPKGKSEHFNEAIRAIVKKAGYKAAFTMENGAIDDKSDLFALNRIGIRDCPLFVFKVRVSGIFESRPFLFMRNIFGAK